VQTLTPAEPLPPQLGDGVIDTCPSDKAHIVLLDLAAGPAAAEHHQEELGAWPFGGWGRINGGPLIDKLSCHPLDCLVGRWNG
jgi:hypothetical protein